MLRKLALLALFVFITARAGKTDENRKSVKLSSGKTVEVFFKKHSSPETGTVFLVECATEEKIIREETVERDVLEIWAAVEEKADETELEEAIISYKYLIENIGENGEAEKVFTVSFFTAEKTENLKWKIEKIG